VKLNKIKQTSPDKVNGKLIKYRQGDCLSIDCKNGRYVAVLVSEKFNKYYDFTLLEYYDDKKPSFADFVNGRFFGTRFGSWEELTYAVDKRMIPCKYVDNCVEIEEVGNVNLIDGFLKASYGYIDDLDQLLEYYLEEIPIRVEKTKNSEKFPDLAFVSKHLVEMKYIMADNS
jgi:hypothetical protein